MESYWEQAGPSFRDFKSRGNVSCDKYFHQNEPHKLNWKTFPDRHVCPSKLPKLQRFNRRRRCPGRSCARSSAPRRTEGRNSFQPLSDQQDHLDDSLRNASVCLLGWHKVRFVASLPLQNIIIPEIGVIGNLDEEHELARGVGGADNSFGVEATIKPSRPLVTWNDNSSLFSLRKFL